ncbi:MAG: gliding motility-associated C-terminal domain-containing protein [Bacteroidota bacterium]|nr:gliding motility-associated C-terminal domain-containing protein [Bacteroidota bacterium]
MFFSAKLCGQNPVASFTYSNEPNEPCIDFSNTSTGNIVTSTWSVNGDMIQQYFTLQNFWYCFPDSGCYEVKLVVQDNSGVSDSSIQQVCIAAKTIIFIPNAFSPNGDGINDVFFVEGIYIPENKFEMRIYDYWGGKVFSSFEPNIGWDGRGPAEKNYVQEGFYLLELIWFDTNNEKHTSRSTIFLFK